MKTQKSIHSITVTSLILLLLLVIIEFSYGQTQSNDHLPYIPILGRKLTTSEIFQPKKNIHKASDHYTKQDWKQVIDETWGPGLSTSEKLAIFDRAWNAIDQGYGAFVNLDVNLDSLRNLYRPEIEAGVSRGRFAAIMNYFSFALKDAHTFIADVPVTWGTYPVPGSPLFVIGSSTDNDYFGACLTPLPDSSLLVYKVVPNHRLGLMPGDIVLGYDGISWKELYQQLWEAQLPVHAVTWGSYDESMAHILLQSAGMNWHLFDTIDIVKYSTGDTLHLSTSPMQYQRGNIWGNEQLPVPGVPMPNFWTQDYISWGIVSGTQIGYIYVASWHWEDQYQISEQFYDAIYNLMSNYETKGMIIDFRLNYGGDMREAHNGYTLLFNTPFAEVAFDMRGDPNDHLDMVPSTTHPNHLWTFQGDPNTFYDKPIAVLTGPNAVSNGDWESLRTQFHPMVRTFGKSTNGAFTTSDYPDLGHPDWFFTKATGSGYLIDGHIYLAHTGAEIDEEVGLTQEDVAKGEDTVVKAAMQWIQNSVFAHDVQLDRIYAKPGIDSVGITAKVENLNNHDILVQGLIFNSSGEAIDSTLFYDDGNHNDGTAGDGLWGAFWQATQDEQHYSFKTKLNDLESGITRNDYNITRFTTIGPVVLDGYVNVSADTLINPGDVFPIKLILKNDGLTTTASYIYIGGNVLDTVVTDVNTSDNTFADIAPGETVTSNGIFVIHFADNFEGGREIQFEVDIYSDNFLFWKDTFSVYIYPTHISSNENSKIPEKFYLSQNYPNPFNAETTIGFDLPRASQVDLIVYDVRGKEIKKLVHHELTAGSHQVKWDGKDNSGRNVASGVYFYKIIAKGLTITKKALLIK